MFNDKVKTEYQSVKAPAELYERILNTDRPGEKKAVVIPFRRYAAIAAALAVIVCSAFVLTGRNAAPDIYLGSERLTGEITLTSENNDGIMLARTGREIGCEMTLRLKKDTVVTTVNGILLSDSGEVILTEGEEKTFSEPLQCKWLVPDADREMTYSICLSDKKGTYTINLYFDKQTDSWTVSLTK
ncbi:MAG: hypothetical protein J6A97_03825 [Clostridia bacterium]|nr:hypothetical protein [Clostridia bacterium]